MLLIIIHAKLLKPIKKFLLRISLHAKIERESSAQEKIVSCRFSRYMVWNVQAFNHEPGRVINVFLYVDLFDAIQEFF
jgi:hypothetical protein